MLCKHYIKKKIQYSVQRPIVAITVILSLVPNGANAGTSDYVIDFNNAKVLFSVNYLKNSRLTGGVYKLTGKLQYSNHLQQGYINLKIPMRKLQTSNAFFIKILKGKDFFDIKTYPIANFESTKWHFSNNTVKSIDGLLTIHGKTNTVTLTATNFSCKLDKTLNKTMCRGKFGTVIDRTRWGMNKYLMLGIPKEVKIDIDIKAVKQ